jgi:hypothetical protein
MSDLITWLRQQLDDDERVARQVMAEPGGFYLEAETDDTNVMTIGAHVYRWDPARVLAEVEAKRRILDAYEMAAGVVDLQDGQPDAEDVSALEALADVVRALAQPYARREGWREGWRV